MMLPSLGPCRNAGSSTVKSRSILTERVVAVWERTGQLPQAVAVTAAVDAMKVRRVNEWVLVTWISPYE